MANLRELMKMLPTYASQEQDRKVLHTEAEIREQVEKCISYQLQVYCRQPFNLDAETAKFLIEEG